MIDELITRMTAMLELPRAEGDQRQYYLGTCLRTTIAVAQALERGRFADAEW